VTLLRDIPFAASYFTTYEMSKYYQKKVLDQLGLLGDHDLNTVNHLVAGATAGCVASFVTLPIDTVKTRIQTEALTLKKSLVVELTQAHKPIDDIPQVPRSGMLKISKIIYQQEGLKGFYRGLAPRLISIIPSASITFAAYEGYKKILGV
jgi:solute carrier family 25 iron transporter 28/37